MYYSACAVGLRRIAHVTVLCNGTFTFLIICIVEPSKILNLINIIPFRWFDFIMSGKRKFAQSLARLSEVEMALPLLIE